jgi:type I restriction enzyme S subunit
MKNKNKPELKVEAASCRLSENTRPLVPIAQVTDINPRPDTDSLDDNTLVSFVPMKCVEEESGRYEPLCDKPLREVKKGYTPFCDGDVLFAKVTPCMENGKAVVMKGLTNGIGYGSTEFYALRPKPGLLAEYLFYFITQESFRKEAARNMTGAVGLRRVPKNYLAEQSIPLPPLPDQHRIVEEIEKQFTRLDAGVKALKRVQANLKRYRAAVLKSACEGRLVPTEAGQSRSGVPPLSKSSAANKRQDAASTYETGEQLLARILREREKNWQGRGKYKSPAAPDTTNHPPNPEGWTWATKPQRGDLNIFNSKHRPRDDKRLYDGPYPFIQTGDVRKSGGIIRGHNQTYSEFGLQQSRLWPEGTLCITIAANIAETGILAFAACFPDSIVGFECSDYPNVVKYICFFINTVREKLEQFAPATAQKNINLEVLQNVAIPLPPLIELTRIVAEVERRLSVIDELETLVTTNLARANRLRQSILQQAFS